MPRGKNEPLEPTKLSQLFRARRDAMHLSRKDVYRKIGISEATLDSYERGRMPRMDVGLRLARLYRITPQEYSEAIGLPSVPNVRAATAGQMLAVYRRRLGWPTDRVADELGVTLRELETYERDEAEAPPSVMARMMALLDRFHDDDEE